MTARLVDEWISYPDRGYRKTDATFLKRELRQDEWIRNLSGHLITPRWSKERLQNEKAALDLIREKTTIPVPRVLSFYERDGAWHLETETVRGMTLDNLNDDIKSRAMNNVQRFIQEFVLPQLRRLRSSRIGGVHGFVIPPNRVSTRDKRSSWPSKSLSTARYVFCHNDLAQHNILVDPETCEVTAIIDWELSGFYPTEFEAPLWLRSYDKRVRDDEETDCLIRFLSCPDDDKLE